MPLYLLVLILIEAILILLAGLLAYLSDKKNRTNKMFLYFSISLAIWVPANFIGSTLVHPQLTKIFVYIDFSSALLLGWAILYFFDSFSIREHRTSLVRTKMFFILTSLLNAILLSTIFLNTLISVSVASGELVVETSNMFYVYVVLILAYMVSAFISLFITYIKADSELKRTLKLIFTGFFAATIANILTNLLFPEIFTDRNTIQQLNILGYTGILIFVIYIYIAITTRKLFDIRLIIARSLGYIFTLAILVGLYVFVIFGFSTGLLGATKLTIPQEIVYIAATLVFGFSLSPMKKFFDRQTNKLFYRDAYDSQVLLDELNKILVGNIDIVPLLRQCAQLFETTLKAEYCTFIIKETDDTTRRVIGSKKVSLDDDQILELSSQDHKIDQIIVADEIEEADSKLKSILSKNNVSILARLAPAGKNAVEQGYLILGNKRSGNPYNKQDLQVLDIIANELVIAIQNALRFEEIEAFTVTLQQKVDDATRQLRQTNEKLKALDETKDEFISMASHQLRTPLTAVKGYVSMVVEGDAGELNKQQKELLDQAFSSSQRMVYLIADLLNVSRLRTGKFVIENKATQLSDVVAAELEQLKQTAAGKQQTLTYDKPDKFPEMMLDETKMRQVIMNFTDNALHYTPKGGHINVSLVDKGKSIEFTVVDDGLGVPKAEQHHLFGKFFRAGNARKARPDGTGLGLFMAKKVIIAQGGAVIFTSTEGKGSTFGFTMPKK